jgi:hypothetical protein
MALPIPLSSQGDQSAHVVSDLRHGNSKQHPATALEAPDLLEISRVKGFCLRVNITDVMAFPCSLPPRYMANSTLHFLKPTIRRLGSISAYLLATFESSFMSLHITKSWVRRSSRPFIILRWSKLWAVWSRGRGGVTMYPSVTCHSCFHSTLMLNHRSTAFQPFPSSQLGHLLPLRFPSRPFPRFLSMHTPPWGFEPPGVPKSLDCP